MVIAGIVAGGIGSRMGQNIQPKQFLELSGKPVVIHTMEKFLVSPLVDYVIVGVHADWLHLMEDLRQKYFGENNRIFLCAGGENRNDTIMKIAQTAHEKCGADQDAILVTHDAVRPFLSLRIIEDNIKCAKEHGVCDTVFEASDTIVRSENGEFITDIPIRREMYQGQTPQSFRLGLFEKVYREASAEDLKVVTDACKLFHISGYEVYLVKGEVMNFKITYPFDLKMARTLMGEERDEND